MAAKTFKLYIGCLPANADEQELIEALTEFGSVKSVSLIQKKGKCVGSANAEADDEQSFKNFIESQIFYQGRKLEISAFLMEGNLKMIQEDMNLRKVAVRNLFGDTTDEEIHEAFSKYGEIENAFMSADKKEDIKGKPKNYGFVIFKDKLDAYKALMGYTVLRDVLTQVRLHRFKQMGETFYSVNGEKILAKDLVEIQLGKAPRHNIDGLMSPEYVEEVQEYLQC